MNKSIKKIYGILLALVMLCVAVCTDSVIANAAMSKSAQHKLYANTMKTYAKKAKSSCRKNSMGNVDKTRKVMYVFVDIDKNGTDELIMRYANPVYNRDTSKASGYGESTSIYTIKNGKVYTVLDNSSIVPGLHSNFVRIYKIEAGLIWDFHMDTLMIFSANILTGKSKRKKIRYI